MRYTGLQDTGYTGVQAVRCTKIRTHTGYPGADYRIRSSSEHRDAQALSTQAQSCVRPSDACKGQIENTKQTQLPDSLTRRGGRAAKVTPGV